MAEMWSERVFLSNMHMQKNTDFKLRNFIESSFIEVWSYFEPIWRIYQLIFFYVNGIEVKLKNVLLVR